MDYNGMFNLNSLIWPNNSSFRLIWGTRETLKSFLEKGGTIEEYQMIALRRKVILEDSELLDYDCEINLPVFEPEGKKMVKRIK